MNKISKKDLKDLLMKKFNEKDEVIVNKIVDELFDLNKKEVFPLDEIETFLFRKRYGVYDGVLFSKEQLVKDLNIGYAKFQKVLDTAFTKLGFRINKIERRSKKEKMSSFEISKQEDILVTNLNITKSLQHILMRNNVFTLKEILELGQMELKKILIPKLFDVLVNYIHILDLKFIDELSLNEKKEIIKDKNIDVIYNSSIYWASVKINRTNSHDIRDLINKINLFPANERDDIKRNLEELGIKIKSLQERSFEELYGMDISNLGLSREQYNILANIGINNIFSLISLTTVDLKTRFNIEYSTVKKIIDNVHSAGLVFIDEAMQMQKYTEIVEDNKKKSK